MLTVLYIFIGILIFGFLIAIHEFGHFITAKLFGVQVNEFSINMGPKLIQKKKGETLYSFRLIPIGGYCAMEGEDGASDNPRAFTNTKWWKRLIILVAGSFMNFVAGFLIMLLVASLTVKYIPNLHVQGFMDESILNQQGEQSVMVGDELVAVDGRRILVYSDFDMLVSRHHGSVMDLTVRRDGKLVTLKDVDMTKQTVIEDGEEKLMYGLYFEPAEPANFGSIIVYSWHECLDFTRLVWFGLSDLIAGRVGIQDMGGPVQIVQVMTQTGNSAGNVGDGILNVLFLGAFIAVNLSVMNLLPIPALDGGRVFLLLIGTVYTAITKKKINPKYEGYIHAAGMVLLLGFMAFITVKDVIQLIR